MVVIASIIGLLTGLAIFMVGIHQMSSGLENYHQENVTRTFKILITDSSVLVSVLLLPPLCSLQLWSQ